MEHVLVLDNVHAIQDGKEANATNVSWKIYASVIQQNFSVTSKTGDFLVFFITLYYSKKM